MGKVNKILLGLFWISLFVFCSLAGAQDKSDEEIMKDAKKSSRNLFNQINDSHGLNKHFFKPMTSSDKMKTMDGSQSFDANVQCSSKAPLIKVQLMPVDSLGGTGALDIAVQYDLNLDGSFEGNHQISDACGVCGNGIIKDGAVNWEGNVKYCRWDVDQGNIETFCNYEDSEGNLGEGYALGYQDMKGCFCFSKACGNPVKKSIVREKIMEFIAKGILKKANSSGYDLTLAGHEFKSGTLMGIFYGASSAACGSISDTQEINKLKNQRNKVKFDTGGLEDTEASTTFKDSMTNTVTTQFKTCKIENKAQATQGMVEAMRRVETWFGRDWPDCGSCQCFWTVGSSCGPAFYDKYGNGNSGGTGQCVDTVVNSSRISQLANQLAPGFSQITRVENVKKISGEKNKYSCYGAGDDRSDIKYSLDIWGLKMDDVFTCFSASMGIPDDLIYNGYHGGGSDADSIYKCEYNDESFPTKSQCQENCNAERFGYTCPLTYENFADASECSSQCVASAECKTSYECSDTQVVFSNLTECEGGCTNGTCEQVGSFTCPETGDSFGTQSECETACVFNEECTDTYDCTAIPNGNTGSFYYDEEMYQGCHVIAGPENNCEVLSEDEDCTLVREEVDGVVTFSDGVWTGIEPMGSCKNIQGQHRGITVCEPWWEKERTYKCATQEADFEKVKKRVKHNYDNVGYNKDSAVWETQGDLRFPEGEENGISNVFNPEIQFDKEKKCEYSCLVSSKMGNPNILTPQQGKLEADASYDGDYEGDSFVQSSETEIIQKRACEKQNETWVCPTRHDETVEYGCSCDITQFGEAAAFMSNLSDMPQDIICSSGEEVGTKEETVKDEYIGCVKQEFVSALENPDSNNYNATNFTEGIPHCTPNLWKREDELSNQIHKIWADDDYHCKATVDGLSEGSDYFENDFGVLTPTSAWFDPVVNWAKPIIVNYLKTDPDFIPDPGPECPCEGSDGPITSTPDEEDKGTYECEWNVQTSVDNINRRDKLKLEPERENLFGEVELFFSSVGEWGGTHIAECDEVENFEYEPILEEVPCEEMEGNTFYSVYDNFKSKKSNKGNKWFGLWSFSENIANMGLKPPIVCSSKMWYKATYGNRRTKGRIKLYFDGNVVADKIGPWKSSGSYKKIGTSTRINAESGTVRVRFYGRSSKTNQKARFKINSGSAPSALVCTGEKNQEIEVFLTPYNQGGSARTGKSWKSLTTTVSFPEAQSGESYNLKGTVELKEAQDTEMTNGVKTYAEIYLGGTLYATSETYIGLRMHNWERLYWGAQDVPGSLIQNGQATIKIYFQAITSDDYYARIPSGEDAVSYYPTGQAVEDSGWFCPVNSDFFDTKTECEDNCVRFENTYRCNDGTIVNTPEDCKAYFCPLSESYYSDLSVCEDECTQEFSCNAQSEDYEFEVAIQNKGNNDYRQSLSQNSPDSRMLNISDYLHEDLILNQCYTRYINPTTDFTDNNGYSFKYSISDQSIFNKAAIDGEQPYKEVMEGSGTHLELPDTPYIYTGGSPNVPRWPQFRNKQANQAWTNDNNLVLGKFDVVISNIKPWVYYYECPVGDIEPGTVASACNALQHPYGGVDETIKGHYCFQNRCDKISYNNPYTVESGTGFVGDGIWE